MRLLKKTLSILVLSTMVANILTGCSSQNPTNTPTDTPTDTPKSTTTEPPAAEKTEVVVWSYSFRDPAQKQQIVDSFDALGKDITLTFKELPQGTQDEIGEKLVTNLIGGEKIDIFDANVASYFNFASKGLLEPLDSYLAKETAFDVNSLGESNVNLSKIDGALYGLPYIKSKFLLYYNTDLFDAANIPYPTSEWTWDDFRETAKKLTSGEGSEKVWGFTMPDWPCTWTGLATQTGLRFVNDDNTLNFDDPAFKEGLQFKYDLTMVDKSGPSLAENKTTKAHYAKQFSAGNVAMLISGDWTIGQIATNLENNFTFKYNITDIPHPEGVAPGTTFGSPRYVGINSKSDAKTKEAAWEVLKHLSSEEVAVIMTSNNVALPAVSSPAVEASFLKSVPEFVTNAPMVLMDAPYVEEKAMHVASNAIDQILKEESELFLTNSKSLDEAMAAMQKRTTEEVEKIVNQK